SVVGSRLLYIACWYLAFSARLSKESDLHIPRPGQRPARRRLSYTAVKDRPRFRRIVRQRFPARQPEPFELSAGEANRLHFYHAGGGVRLSRGARAACSLYPDHRF